MLTYAKKIILSIFILIALGNGLFAQLKSTSQSGKNIGNSTSTFYQIQKEMNNYWDSKNVKNGFVIEDGVKRKVPNWKLYKRWEYYWEQRVDQKTGEFPTTTSVDEYQKYLKTHNNLKKTNAGESWVNLGTNSSTGGYAGLGRINCIAFHPTDANIAWVGSPSGGIWKTENLNAVGGPTWTILNNSQSVLGVSDIAIPYDFNGTTVNTIYIATGDRDGGSLSSLAGGQGADNTSIGVLKSVDGGANWNATGLTSSLTGTKIYRLLIHPTNTQILLASTSNGIYKTINGGTDWSSVNPNEIIDMEFKPGEPTIVYGTSIGYGDVYLFKSVNTGDSFSFSIPGTSNGGYRGELAVSANNSAVVYILMAKSNGGLANIYKSVNSGGSFTALLNPAPAGTDDGKSLLGYESDGNGPNEGQGKYDLCIATSPIDANTVFIGGINTWRSVNGGVNWTCVTHWSTDPPQVVHADKHALAFQPVTNVLFEGNDGGIYKTADGGTNWTDLSNGLVISQIYRIGVSQTSSNTVLTGLQDNGTKKYSSTWSDVDGGDGMECIVDYSNANYMYSTYVEGQITRSSNGFTTWGGTNISANIPGGQPIGAWVTPYVISPSSSSTLFAGYDKVWKTADRGNNWTSASQVLSSGSKLRSLAIAPSNSAVLYAADKTNMWKTTDGGASDWTDITLSLPTSSNYITYIAVKNDDPNTVWITYGGFTDGSKVYESIDGGGIWTNISAGLPNLPVMCIVQYKDLTDRNVLFVGTDVGVYMKDGTNAWAAYNSGLPNVVVSELEIFYASGGAVDKLRAGTYGRGLWETDINAPLPVELSSFTASVKENSVLLKWMTATEVSNYGFEIERKVSSMEYGVMAESKNRVGRRLDLLMEMVIQTH
ncbi:MAG: hypothetical protein V1720_01610 [bacterium]